MGQNECMVEVETSKNGTEKSRWTVKIIDQIKNTGMSTGCKPDSCNYMIHCWLPVTF